MQNKLETTLSLRVSKNTEQLVQKAVGILNSKSIIHFSGNDLMRSAILFLAQYVILNEKLPSPITE